MAIGASGRRCRQCWRIRYIDEFDRDAPGVLKYLCSHCREAEREALAFIPESSPYAAYGRWARGEAS